MPRKEVGERSESWEISMRDEILFPKLSKKHKKMSQMIRKAYDEFDALYEHVAKILDEAGIFGSYRLTYRAYAEKIWKATQIYSSKALDFIANAIANLYNYYGCDWNLLIKIASVFGVRKGAFMKRALVISLDTGLGGFKSKPITLTPELMFNIMKTPPIYKTTELTPLISVSTKIQSLNIIWHCDAIADRVYELSPQDFSVVRSAPSPNGAPTGIGGDYDIIWHCDYYAKRVYELSTVDFSVVRSAPSPNDSPYGIGGKEDVIWYCDNSTDRVYELSTVDFSVVRSAPSPYTYPSEIGGDLNVIWHCDASADRVYELSPQDFSVVRSAPSPNGFPAGIGGNSNVIWHNDPNTDKIYELSTVDFSVIRYASSPSGGPHGIGGK